MINRHDRTNPRGLAAFAGRLTEVAVEEAPRRLSDAEALERLEEAFGSVEADAGHRLAVAWRLARALGAAQGHLDTDTPLAAVPERAWSEHTAGTIQGHPEGTAPWIIEAAHAPIGLRPSAQAAGEFREVAWSIASRLGIRRTREGRLGLLSLLDAIDGEGTVSWPEPWQLVALEDALVLHTFETATRTADPNDKDVEPASEVKAARLLREEFGLTEPEVASVLALAHRRALDAMPSGQDSLRALQFHALEDLARRAASSLDLRSEIAARRLLAQVSGVTRTAPEDLQQEFLGVVRKIAAIQDARPVLALPAPRSEAGPRVIEAEVMGDDDGEALADFDRENGG
jgi:hypothetical protein